MKTLEYQEKAVRQLVDYTLDLLGLDGTRHTLVFRAPTGSGKTVMTTMALEQVTLQTRGGAQEPAMIWIAPNALHEQSYFKMKNYFGETRELRPVMYDEMDRNEGLLHPGEVLFVNWESINKEKNLMVRDTEQGCSIYETARRTREAGHPIIVVIDEEHDFWDKTADKSRKVLDRIDPKIELRVSATPKTLYATKLVSIDRREVIAEEMIKEGIVLNPNVSKDISDERTLTQHLIELALRKRRDLAEAYERQGTNINPLLLIQLPNDKAAMSDDDTRIRDTVEKYLEVTNWDMTTANGRLAVWLSDSKDKQNLEGIEKPDSMVQALLFKQAIAKGWDCPRAAVLLIFRKMNSMTFTMQTVGRILRMPEQHFYPDPLLNKGYVYTDLSADKIEIVADGIGYISTLLAKRREDIAPIALDGQTSIRRSESRNRLGSDFKKVLRQTFVDLWGLAQTHMEFDEDPFPTGAENPCGVNRRSAELKAHITFDVQKVQVWIPEDVDLNLEGVTLLDGHRIGYARKGIELQRLYNDFCERNIVPFEKLSAATLGRVLIELMEELFESYENEAKKVILYYRNSPKFAEVIRIAKVRYEQLLGERKRKAAERAIVDTRWELPADRLYDESTNQVVPNMENHALEPFIRQNQASTPEKRFEDFLEKHKEQIAWWYKNGDKGRDHYAIEYTKADESKSLFYIDFIIQMKNGRIMLFDTKSINSDNDAVAKHNALVDYLKQHEGMGGGVIIQDEATGNWLYSDTYIENTTDLGGWKAFFPDSL